jgi:transposase
MKGMLYVGLDVSKGRAEAAAVGPGKERLGKSRQFLDRPKDHERLCQWIEQWVVNTGADGIQIGMEPTGGYEVHFFRSLNHHTWPCPARVRLLPTVTAKKHIEAQGGATQTDKTSAWSLAESLASYPDVEVRTLDPEHRRLRRLARRVERDEEHLRQLENDLSEEIFETAPFLVQYIRYGIPRWMLHLLREYPTAKRIAVARAPKIRYARAEKLEAIRRAAREEAESLPHDPVTAESIQTQVELILSQRKHNNLQKEKLLRLVKERHGNNAGFQVLLEMKDLGEYTASVVFLELLLGKEYPHADAVLKAAGLDLVEHTSGDRKGKMRISKRGPGDVRRVLYLAAWRLVQHEPVFREYYQRQLNRVPGLKKRALVAVMKKLLRVIWKMYTTAAPFDGEHEMRWKAAHPQAEDQNAGIAQSASKPPTHSPEDLEQAPISRRYWKKTKETTGHNSAVSREWVVTAPPSSSPALPREDYHNPEAGQIEKTPAIPVGRG